MAAEVPTDMTGYIKHHLEHLSSGEGVYALHLDSIFFKLLPLNPRDLGLHLLGRRRLTRATNWGSSVANSGYRQAALAKFKSFSPTIYRQTQFAPCSTP